MTFIKYDIWHNFNMIFLYEIWPSFWYDGGKNATFLEFRYFFTYKISRKTKRNYRFEMIYDYRFEIYNFIFALFSIWYMTVILKWAKNMTFTLIWLRLRQSANQSDGAKIFKTQNFNLQIFITKKSLWMQFFVHRICFVENIFFRLQNFV